MTARRHGLATVLMCTYNDEATIADALQSALDQTAPPASYALRVVDDGSTDATPEILAGLRSERVEVLRLPANRGLPHACNAGLEGIRTPSYVRVDADDRCDPGLVEALLEARLFRGADIVSTDRWEEGPDGERELRELGDPPRVADLIAAGVLLPTELVRRLGGYRDVFWEEFDLMMRLFESGQARSAHVAQPLYTYRVGDAGRMTSDAEAVGEGWRELRRLWPAEVLARYAMDGYEAGVPGRAA